MKNKLIEDVSILAYQTSGNDHHKNNIEKQSINEMNILISQLLLPNESNIKNWLPFFIPFTPKDLEGIIGLGGNRYSLRIDLRVPIQILIAQLFSFIVQCKVKELPGEFDITSFFDFIFSQSQGLIKFDAEDRKSMEKNLIKFLNNVIKVCKNQKFVLIDPVGNNFRKFIIKIKKTENLTERLGIIKEDLIKFIDNDRRQRKIEETVPNLVKKNIIKK
jgi:hypothetical protein